MVSHRKPSRHLLAQEVCSRDRHPRLCSGRRPFLSMALDHTPLTLPALQDPITCRRHPRA